MKTFYISSSAWLEHRLSCKSIAERVIHNNAESTDAIIIDVATARRLIDIHFNGSIVFFETDLRNWVNETLSEQGTINIEAIRRAVATLGANDVFVINATGFHASTIHSALHQLRIGFYSREAWPLALALIGDDSQLYDTCPILAETFYIRPRILERKVIKRTVRRITIDAMYLRIFGKSYHSWIFGKILNAIFSTSTIKIRRADKNDAKQQQWRSTEN